MSDGEARLLAIYRDTVRELFATVAGWTRGDRELTEDVVQETYLRAVRSWRREVPSNPAAWLRVVARHLLVSERRRSRPCRSLPEDLRDPAPDSTARVEIAEAMAGVGQERADLLRAFHVEGRSTAEIAARTQLSPRAVEGRLHRARRALAGLLRGPDRENVG